MALSAEMMQAVLRHLGVAQAEPDLALLDALVEAYTRAVPWESAFRIAKRAATTDTEECPRWPEEFWEAAIALGGGGTCYESNYAFFELLSALGYQGYLTVNNMGATVGCHTAAIIHLGEERWLVDVGIPLHTPIRLDPTQTTRRKSKFFTYSVQPQGTGRYEITRDRHPSPYIFTLIDQPVAEGDYRAVTARDYDENGLFLDAVIVNKVIDGKLWRFNGRESGESIAIFSNGEQAEQAISGDVAEALAKHFSMDVETLRAAFDATH